jgi:hypothetical protein
MNNASAMLQRSNLMRLRFIRGVEALFLKTLSLQLKILTNLTALSGICTSKYSYI